MLFAVRKKGDERPRLMKSGHRQSNRTAQAQQSDIKSVALRANGDGSDRPFELFAFKDSIAIDGQLELAGLIATGVEVEGLSFTAPLGRTLIWMMTSTAGGVSFSVGSVCGVLLGALPGSIWRGLFRWEACEDPRELGRQVSGAAMMGVGGVIALGCSVGQGVSAFATLAWSGPVTLIAIGLGAMYGLRRLIGGFQPE